MFQNALSFVETTNTYILFHFRSAPGIKMKRNDRLTSFGSFRAFPECVFDQAEARFGAKRLKFQQIYLNG